MKRGSNLLFFGASMKFNLNILIFFVLAGLSSAFAQTSLQTVPFDKKDCDFWFGSRYGSRVCESMQLQYNSSHFRRDLIYEYGFSYCDRITGNFAMRPLGPTNIPCAYYVTDSEAKRSIIIKSQFGNIPQYPLMFQGLMINIKIARTDLIIQSQALNKRVSEILKDAKF